MDIKLRTTNDNDICDIVLKQNSFVTSIVIETTANEMESKNCTFDGLKLVKISCTNGRGESSSHDKSKTMGKLKTKLSLKAIVYCRNCQRVVDGETIRRRRAKSKSNTTKKKKPKKTKPEKESTPTMMTKEREPIQEKLIKLQGIEYTVQLKITPSDYYCNQRRVTPNEKCGKKNINIYVPNFILFLDCLKHCFERTMTQS